MRAILEENQAEKERSRYNLCPISFNFVKKVRDLWNLSCDVLHSETIAVMLIIQ